ncbi:tyrosine-type recombinase/integrase [Natranaerobius trueperi]|uniref:Integrase n=1 Tax=Natranaerobius trueperi TaxID=759412 RepID=A0A226BWP4_9FIRM|nr:tyrosine-type recombinase/integrase [Natranaerobius trueperi]OWZ83385.1 integrase [Natranaerobius trueperi]
MTKDWEITTKAISSKNREIVNDYISELSSINKSKETIKLYRNVLKRVFLINPKDLTKWSSKDILYCIDKLSEEKQENTESTYITVISAFLKFCKNEEYITDLNVKPEWRPKLTDSLPRYLEENELVKARIQSEKEKLRDRLLFEFFVSSGARCCEAYSLNIQNLDLKKRTAKVIGKGKKIRFIYFNEVSYMLFKKYLKNRHQSKGAVFLSQSKKRLSTRRMQVIIKNIGKKANLSSKLTPHRLRHTFATDLLNKGAEMSYIGDQLGHTNLNVTGVYARLLLGSIDDEYKRCME